MLDPAVLRESIRPFFSPGTMPRGRTPQVVAEWGSAYIRYAQSAAAGGLLPSPLSPVPADGDFFWALDESFRATWMAAVWAAPGFAGKTALVPSLVPFMEANRSRLLRSYDPDFALSVIAEAIHTYTLSISVAIVSAGGTPSTATLT